MTKKVRERDFFLALMKKREAEKKTGVTSVYLPEEIDTGFLSRDHSGTVSIWSDKKSQTITFNETSLEELLWRHKFLDRRIVDEILNTQILFGSIRLGTAYLLENLVE